MANFEFLNKHRHVIADGTVMDVFLSTPLDGFNGMFRIPHSNGTLRVIAGDGKGWQHVSVSWEDKNDVPDWETMCYVKDLFWNDEDVVVQFHPRKSEYVNIHPGVLHLWRCTTKEFPTPMRSMV